MASFLAQNKIPKHAMARRCPVIWPPVPSCYYSVLTLLQPLASSLFSLANTPQRLCIYSALSLKHAFPRFLPRSFPLCFCMNVTFTGRPSLSFIK